MDVAKPSDADSGPACRTSPVSPTISDFGHCLAATRKGCPHAMTFGDGVLCFHPQWKSFVQGAAKGD